MLTYVIFTAFVISEDAMTIKEEKVLQWVESFNFVNCYHKDIFDFKESSKTLECDSSSTACSTKDKKSE